MGRHCRSYVKLKTQYPPNSNSFHMLKTFPPLKQQLIKVLNIKPRSSYQNPIQVQMILFGISCVYTIPQIQFILNPKIPISTQDNNLLFPIYTCIQQRHYISVFLSWWCYKSLGDSYSSTGINSIRCHVHKSL